MSTVPEERRVYVAGSKALLAFSLSLHHTPLSRPSHCGSDSSASSTEPLLSPVCGRAYVQMGSVGSVGSTRSLRSSQVMNRTPADRAQPANFGKLRETNPACQLLPGCTDENAPTPVRVSLLHVHLQEVRSSPTLNPKPQAPSPKP